MSAAGITLLVEDQGWRKSRGLVTRLRRAAEAALAAARLQGNLTVLLGSDARLKSLNHQFRGKNKPTNVLSFPAAGDDGYRGDIAIAYGVARKEAQASGKKLADHACHLVVHGVLHLAGYDHERDADARIMEPLEAKILGRLGIPDPYGASASKSVKRGETVLRTAPEAPLRNGRVRAQAARPSNKAGA